MNSKPLILAIESAVAGGSISLIRGETEIANWTGGGGISRAEDLLLNIASLLKHTGTPKENLEQLAVSIGPGSYTGIRIGIATALGLKNGLQIPCAGVSVTAAMMRGSSDSGTVVTAVPIGKNDVCRQESSQDSTVLTTYAEFLEFAHSNPEIRVIAEKSLFLRLIESNIAAESRIIDAGSNLAYYVGLAALKADVSETLEPLFVKAA